MIQKMWIILIGIIITVIIIAVAYFYSQSISNFIDNDILNTKSNNSLLNTVKKRLENKLSCSSFYCSEKFYTEVYNIKPDIKNRTLIISVNKKSMITSDLKNFDIVAKDEDNVSYSFYLLPNKAYFFKIESLSEQNSKALLLWK